MSHGGSTLLAEIDIERIFFLIHRHTISLSVALIGFTCTRLARALITTETNKYLSASCLLGSFMLTLEMRKLRLYRLKAACVLNKSAK